MSYTSFILELFILVDVPELPPKYISEHGGVSVPEVFMYFETNALDLSSKTR